MYPPPVVPWVLPPWTTKREPTSADAWAHLAGIVSAVDCAETRVRSGSMSARSEVLRSDGGHLDAELDGRDDDRQPTILQA